MNGKLENFLANISSSPVARKLIPLLIFLIGFLLLFTLVDTVKTWYADWHLVSETKPVVNDAADQTQQLMHSLPNTHIFGQSTASAHLPITSLQLHLTGIIKTSDNSISRALISEGGKSSKVYSVGDELVSGIKLHAINSNEVILESDGHLEKLPLTRAPLLFHDSPKPLW